MNTKPDNNSTADNYLFLGLHNSGKTTLFVLMAQHLQRYTNCETNDLAFKYCNQETDDFINKSINKLKKQEWIENTTKGVAYSFELVKNYSLKLPVITDNGGNFLKKILSIKLKSTRPVLQKTSLISYRDYPGEAFEAAFVYKDIVPTNPTIKEAVQDIKERIKSAKGLFLVLDAECIFNGVNKDKVRETLTKLFMYINDNKPALKVAVIFNKIELFAEIRHDFERELRIAYGNAYAYKPCNCKFFEVLPLGEVATNEYGQVIPPKHLSSKNLLKPLFWMLGI